MTKRWLSILILFLLVGNAALITTVFVKNNSPITERFNANRKDGEKNNRKCSRFELMLAEELNFDTVQKQKVNDLILDFHQTQKSNTRELRRLKKQYFDELSQAEPDTVLLNNIALKIGEIEARKIKLDYEHYRDIRSVCTAEQALKMDSIGRDHVRGKFKDRGFEKPRRRDNSRPRNNN